MRGNGGPCFHRRILSRRARIAQTQATRSDARAHGRDRLQTQTRRRRVLDKSALAETNLRGLTVKEQAQLLQQQILPSTPCEKCTSTLYCSPEFQRSSSLEALGANSVRRSLSYHRRSCTHDSECARPTQRVPGRLHARKFNSVLPRRHCVNVAAVRQVRFQLGWHRLKTDRLAAHARAR